jgi:hypothetical protein
MSIRRSLEYFLNYYCKRGFFYLISNTKLGISKEKLACEHEEGLKVIKRVHHSKERQFRKKK